jgi:probable HAF family extracellular repeat protein
MYTIKDLGPAIHPTAVNDAAQIVGYMDVGDVKKKIFHAFFWDSGAMIDLHDNWPQNTTYHVVLAESARPHHLH